MLTDRGRSGARVLCAYWLVALPCLWAGCVGSRAKARAKEKLKLKKITKAKPKGKAKKAQR